MATYTASANNVTLSTSSDNMTIIPASGHSFWLIEVSIAGMGTASAANSLGVYRSTAGTTGGGAITPTPVRKLSATPTPPASTTTVDTTWATQPTLGTTPVLLLGVNANGGIYRWVARPGEELEFVGGIDQCSLRAVTGSSSVSIHVVWSEDPQ